VFERATIDTLTFFAVAVINLCLHWQIQILIPFVCLTCILTNMPRRVIEIKSSEFYWMLIGDFLGLIFIFVIIFWICDNVKSCRRKVQNVDRYIRRKSSSLASAKWSQKSKDEGYNSKV
jgi:uncharacterized membrane protein YgaE (UPF0421/DUF939 family)